MDILCAFSEALRSPDLLASVRLLATAFLRTRQLTFPKLLTLMLSGICGINHRLALEHLTGISWLAAQQDFGAKILGGDYMPCPSIAPPKILPQPHPKPGNLRRPTAATNPTGPMPSPRSKARCKRWLLSVPVTLDDIGKLFTELMRNLIAFVPGASKRTNMGRKSHKYMAYKACA